MPATDSSGNFFGGAKFRARQQVERGGSSDELQRRKAQSWTAHRLDLDGCPEHEKEDGVCPDQAASALVRHKMSVCWTTPRTEEAHETLGESTEERLDEVCCCLRMQHNENATGEFLRGWHGTILADCEEQRTSLKKMMMAVSRGSNQ